MKVDTDKNWYVSSYKTDIYEHLKVIEEQRRSFHSRSPQLSHRLSLIHYIKYLLEKRNFCRVTLHLAVYILDFFMDSHSIKFEKLTLIAYTCLVLAAKFEEQDGKIPKISEMNAYLNSAYVQEDILYLERKILKYFNWRLTMPTAVHFADYFFSFGIIRGDICENCPNPVYTHSMLQHYLNTLLDRSLEDVLLISYPPSFVAASCLLAVRMTFKLDPLWPCQLKEVTGYSESDLKTCAIRILKYKDEDAKHIRKRKLEQSPDQGYETEKDSNVSPKTKKG